MRFDYINPFVDTARDVLNGFIDSDIKKSSIILKDSLTASGISVTIFLTGSVEGRVILDIEPLLARKIAGYMNGMEFEKLNTLAIDTICELTNIIIGKAITSLNNKGFRFRPSPPSFFIGAKTYYGLESLCISLSTEWGDIRIQAAIQEKNRTLTGEGRVYA
jgi:chemotaxis protein CheX